MTTSIEDILNPRSIAILGASDDLSKWGGSMLALLQKFGFSGSIYPVNPRSDRVQGIPAFASVTAIGQVVDVALFAVPHERAIDALHDCATAGVKAILMVTSQFAESGAAGQQLQDTLMEIARSAGIRIIGPNCMGYFHSHANLCLLNSQALMRNATLIKGNIALISQSGALAGAMLARAYDLGTGFSFCVSLGNQADLEVCDFLEYAVTDRHTQVISLYVEGLKNPQRFLELLRRARSVGKPVLMVKAGRTDSGRRAVQSHTASMAGPYQAFEAAVRYEGAVLVDDYLELVTQAAAWATLAAPCCKQIAVFSGSGGGGAVASDLIGEAGLQVATLSEATVEKLAPLVPQGVAHLPFDLGAVPASERMRDPQWLNQVLSQMMSDPNVGAGIFVMTTQPDMVGAAQVVIDLNKNGTKPLLFVNAASSCASDALERLKAAGMVQFASVKEAARYLVNRLTAAPTAHTDQQWQEQLPVAEVDRVAAALPIGLVSEYQTKHLLSAAGVPTTRGALAQSEDQAVELAHSIGFPVVMKVVSAQISHKSDIGGVALNVRDEAGVRQQFNLLRAALQKVPGARFEACLVQQMVGADAELLIGSQWDPQFGAMLMFGFGGTLVELQRDTALLPAHASRQSIERALAGLRQYPLLTGYRGNQPADLAKLVSIIQRIGQLASHLGEQLVECEVNPVMVRGDSIWAADARAVWKEKT